MRNFQDTFKTHKRSFSSAFTICMIVPLSSGDKILSLLIKKMYRTCTFLNHFGEENEQ